MDPHRLIRSQLALERIGLDEAECLIRVPGPDPDDIARVAAYRHEGGYLLYFRADVPWHIRQAIGELGPEAAFHGRAAVIAMLAGDDASVCAEHYCTYTFPHLPHPPMFSDAVRLGASRRALIEDYHPGMDPSRAAVFVVIRDGRIVSSCVSAREDDAAAEAYVFTLPTFRRQGYGRQVTAAWGHHLREQGKVAFYSHAHDNTPSRALAHSLGLKPAFDLVAYV